MRAPRGGCAHSRRGACRPPALRPVRLPVLGRGEATDVRGLRGAAPLDGDHDGAAGRPVVQKLHGQRPAVLGPGLPPAHGLPLLRLGPRRPPLGARLLRAALQPRARDSGLPALHAGLRRALGPRGLPARRPLGGPGPHGRTGAPRRVCRLHSGALVPAPAVARGPWALPVQRGLLRPLPRCGGLCLPGRSLQACSSPQGFYSSRSPSTTHPRSLSPYLPTACGDQLVLPRQSGMSR
mmetsp:Transcript_127161/g.395790  ORF Transcript_127161/g.395790 Transcript_127161/m.395790 type:complete len:237 (-) Transcript_127161:815-1525(-)